jgi:16S rRNA pseudouridine516 synthase
MALNRSRLDRFISEKLKISRRDVRLMLAQKRITVDACIATDIEQIIDRFSNIRCDNKSLQNNSPLYIMQHKPTGVVSATKDEGHTTVIDLLHQQLQLTDHNAEVNADYSNTLKSVFENDPSLLITDLHIVGRLDLNTSGLMLLTNDSRWSSHITAPENKVTKYYYVTLEKPLSEAYIEAFTRGMYFEYEGITTQPAHLTILSPYTARLGLVEGKYHQVKRMFGYFDNKVLKLHREKIGQLILDENLIAGESRLLTASEVEEIKR